MESSASLNEVFRALAERGFEIDPAEPRRYEAFPGLITFAGARRAWSSIEWVHVLVDWPGQDAFDRLNTLVAATGRLGNEVPALLWGIHQVPTVGVFMVLTEQRAIPPDSMSLEEAYADRPLDWRDLATRLVPVCDALATLAVGDRSAPVTHGDVRLDDLYVDVRTSVLRLGGFVRGALARRPGDTSYRGPEARPDAEALIEVVTELAGPPADVLERWRAAVRSLTHQPYAAALALKEALLITSQREPTVVDEDVQFSLYRPNAITPGRWHSVLAFAHKTDLVPDDSGGLVDPVEQVEAQARALLAAENTPYGTVRTDSGTALGRGSDLTFELWLEQAEVNPPRAHLVWEEAVHRVEFRVRTSTAPAGARLRGELRVFSAHVLIAESRFSVQVKDVVARPAQPSSPSPDQMEPLHKEPVRRYRKIFASYSHRDGEVVAAVRRYSETTGDRYLIDTETLRSGERWSDRLAELIEQADVFQLFWSHHSMRSPHVRREWEHALSLGREHFVRPVYWEYPFPEDAVHGLPPETLLALHFSSLSPEPLVGPGSATTARPLSNTRPNAEQAVRGQGTMTFCRICGVQVGLDRMFCWNCGNQLRSTAAATGPPEPEPVVSWPPAGPAAPPADESVPAVSDTGELAPVRAPLGERASAPPTVPPAGPPPAPAPAWSPSSYGAPYSAPGGARRNIGRLVVATMVGVLMAIVVLLVVLIAR